MDQNFKEGNGISHYQRKCKIIKAKYEGKKRNGRSLATPAGAREGCQHALGGSAQNMAQSFKEGNVISHYQGKCKIIKAKYEGEKRHGRSLATHAGAREGFQPAQDCSAQTLDQSQTLNQSLEGRRQICHLHH